MLYLDREDIQESAEKILEYTKDMSFDEFSRDIKTISQPG